MRALELVTEAKMDDDIRGVLEEKGYKFLGSGQDQDAFLAPDGTILKIFGWDDDRTKGGLSLAQQSFVDFATYCHKHPNNPFLPEFSDWAMFEFNGNMYLQIKCERMFEMEDVAYNVAAELESFGEMIKIKGVDEAIEYMLKNYDQHGDDKYNGVGETITMLGGLKNIKLLGKTIQDLVKIGKAKNYTWDLHAGNYMLGSDGTVVINDPYFTGSWRDGDNFDDWSTRDPSDSDESSDDDGGSEAQRLQRALEKIVGASDFSAKYKNQSQSTSDDSNKKSDEQEPGSMTKALDKLFKS